MKRIRWAALLFTALLFLFLLIVFLLRPNSPLESSSSVDITQRITDNIRQGRPMQALYYIEALAAQGGWTTDLHRQTGDLWALSGDITRAIPHWQSADIDDPVLLGQLADAYVRTQQWTRASETLQKLSVLTPEDQWTHYQLGLIRAAFDPIAAAEHLSISARVPEYTEISAELLQALEGDESLTAMRVGLVLAGRQMWPYAELAFQHAADSAYPYAEALAYAGIARDWQGKDGTALVEQAVQIEPENPVVRYLQGLHLRFDGDYAASREALIQAVALDPLNPAFYTELGSAYWLVDDLKSAERWLKMAVEISDDPRFAEALEQFYSESGVRVE